MPYKVISADPYTVELTSPADVTFYLRASCGEIEHVTAVHPLVEKTNRVLLLVSTHSSLDNQLAFFRETFHKGEIDGVEHELEAAVVDVLSWAILDRAVPTTEAAAEPVVDLGEAHQADDAA
ncbi:MAG: hypothetical protein LCI03_03200 [Actinobacteria bacterium]|jgi:hypothetical protein|nr:hypothetical protein [Actinomycetota bacterium]